jgi:flagella basal body P-ring formation protein FlgA
MLNGNGRPLGIRKTVRVMIALTILAWATQVLFSQWGYGAEPAATIAESAQIEQPVEKFVPGTARYAAGATLELRSEATIIGEEVKLKQVCRWSERDATVFQPLGDLVLIRLSSKAPFRGITVDQIKSTLHDAGVNMAAINFSGAMSCTVNRSDVKFNEGEALEQWINARTGENSSKQPSIKTPAVEVPVPAVQAPIAPAAVVEDQESPFRTLRQLLTADLATRMGVPAESLQMNFNPQDERVLNLSEPHFRFNLEPRRARSLGSVSWDVLIVTDTGNQKISISGNARAWQDQVVAIKPLSLQQIVRDDDVADKRILVDQLGSEPLLKRSQIVGQQAGRELKPGTIITAPMIDPVPLARAGQFITITLQQGAVQIKSVARAMEPGSFGQTIKVRNETTRDVFEVTLTGPQMAQMGAVSAGRTNVASVND